MTKPDTTKGRVANAAQPLGERTGTTSEAATERAGKASLAKAGPDSGAVGKSFKAK